MFLKILILSFLISASSFALGPRPKASQNKMDLKKQYASLSFFKKGLFKKQDELACGHLQFIKIQYIMKHIRHNSLSPSLEKRTIDQMIKTLDRNKIHFLAEDIQKIKKWMKNIYIDIGQADCTSLEKLYRLFYRRVKERAEFAKKEINSPQFKLNENISVILDSKKRKYSESKAKLDAFHKKFIQYEAANVLLAEEDLDKAKKYLIDIYDRMVKKVYSWDPAPSKERIQFCLKEEKINKLVKTCKYEKWYSIYLNSFARALDPHSSYLSRYDLDDFKINMDLSLEGVGALLSSKYGYTTIERLIPGGAAQKSGRLKKKDQILAIGQSKDKMINIFGWDIRDVVQMVRGKKGTTVHLKILRTLKDEKKYKFTVSLVRKKIELKDAEASISYSKKKIHNQEQTVGVIRIPSFYGGSGKLKTRSVSEDVQKLIRRAKKKQISALVLDLTGNGGGILSEAVDVAGLFIEKGRIVRQVTRGGKGRSIYYTLEDKDGSIEYKGPLVVLVDRNSASASEIVAGALKDYKRAVIVGEDHTFGKGSIQSVENIEHSLGATKTTIGLFFIPSGKSTQKLGILTDIPFVVSTEDIVEKKLDYALPNEHTASFLTRNIKKAWKPITPLFISKLKARSKSRVRRDENFKKIKEDIVHFNEKIKNKKEIKIKTLLSSAKERKEEEKKEDFEDYDIHDPRFKKKYLERADVNEAVNVALDMALIDPALRLSSGKKTEGRIGHL